MDYIEVTAKTVSEAITKACIDLNLPSDRLDIKVISEGSKGFLGIGSKPAVIRVAKKEEEIIEEAVIEKEVRKETSDFVNKKSNNRSNHKTGSKKEVPVRENDKAKENDVKKEDSKEESGTEAKENSKRKDRHHKKSNNKGASEKKESDKKDSNRNGSDKIEAAASEKEKKPVIREIIPVEKTEEEIAEMKEATGKFLQEVFQAMNVEVNINSEYVAETACLEIELEGNDMGVLIGHRGQTLDSLQYLTSLVLNKNKKEYIRVKIDTEDYRKRRKETLENLAKNIAYKVRKTRRPVVLEAMNPFERRIIHSALQPNKYVDTYSEGKEPYRHVVIVPKRNS